MTKAEDIANKKKEIILYFASMPVYKYAAHSVGISEITLERWRKDDQVFDGQLNQAKSAFFNKLGKRMKPEFMAERLDRETWAPPKQEHSIEGNVVEDILKAYGIVDDDTGRQPDGTEEVKS